jgi:hypothetical protein
MTRRHAGTNGIQPHFTVLSRSFCGPLPLLSRRPSDNRGMGKRPAGARDRWAVPTAGSPNVTDLNERYHATAPLADATAPFSEGCAPGPAMPPANSTSRAELLEPCGGRDDVEAQLEVLVTALARAAADWWMTSGRLAPDPCGLSESSAKGHSAVQTRDRESAATFDEEQI